MQRPLGCQSREGGRRSGREHRVDIILDDQKLMRARRASPIVAPVGLCRVGTR